LTDMLLKAAKEKMIEDIFEAYRLDKVPPGKGMCFTVADEEVAIINVDGTIYAMKVPAFTRERRWVPGSWTVKSSPAGPHGWR